jgi:hypothetical protein
MKDFKQHQVSMATLSSLTFIPSLPWSLKFLFAGFSDSVSVFGYHRKPYMIFGNFVAMLMCFIMLLPTLHVSQFVSILTSLQTAVVISDVNYDAILMEECKKLSVDDASSLILKVKTMRTLGQLLGKTMGPILWGYMSSFGIYVILAFFYFISFLISISTPDVYRPATVLDLAMRPARSAISIELNEYGERLNSNEQEDASISQKTPCCRTRRICFTLGLLRESLMNEYLGSMLLFTIMTGLCPTADLPMFYYLTDDLHYSTYDMSMLAFLAEIGKLFGYFIYSKVFSKWRLRNTYFVLTFMTIAVQCIPLMLTSAYAKPVNDTCASHYNVTTLHQNETCFYFEELKIPPMVLSASESLLGDGVSELFWIPVERVTSIVCTATLEATIYASVLSIGNLTGSLKGFVDMFFIIYFDIDHGKTVNLQTFQLFCIYLEIVTFLMAILLPNVTMANISEQVQREKDLELTTRVSFRF